MTPPEAAQEFELETLAQRVVFGRGSSRSALLAQVQRLGLRRLLVLSTEQEATLALDLAQPLADRVAGTFSAARPHVPAATVEAALAALRGVGADGLLSVGGGSTTGTAKALALRTGLPILAVPTTYAGSEVTPIWGTTTEGHKETGRSPVVLPTVVVYDPDLTMTLPAGLTGTSAMNAMAHCVEAFYGPGANPVTDLLAAEGIRALAAGLPDVMADLEDSAGRSLLLYGAFLAGSAFATAGSGLHHTICHVLGGAYDLPHAETHCVVLPHVAAFNEVAVPALRDRAAPALGSRALAAGITALTARIGAPTALADLGMNEADLPAAVRLVMEKDLSRNPRPIGADEVAAILTAAFHGTPADGYLTVTASASASA